MSQYRHNSIANSSHLNLQSKRYSNAQQGFNRPRQSITPRAIEIQNGANKMEKIGGLYSQTNTDLMLYEVEIVDTKLEHKVNIEKAAERGLCICQRWNFILVGNIVILILMSVAIGVTMILNNSKENSKIPLTINDTCNAGSTDCDIKADLKCPAGICICNANKNWNGTDCVCPLNQYWDGYNCLTSKNYTEKCSSSILCLTYLQCDTTTYTCQCETTKYFKNNACVDKLQYNSTCTSYLQCQDYLGVTCLSGKCQCPSRYYWNGLQCANKLLNGSVCTNNGQCDDSLGLSCQTAGSTKLCLCNTTWYWDLTMVKCEPTKPYQEPCTYDYECISSKYLFCQTQANACNCPYQSTVGMCDCPVDRFWDMVTCASRNSINGSCQYDSSCRANTNLKCLFGYCICQSPFPTWSGSIATGKCV